MRIPVNLVGQTYEGRSRAIDSERSINWYPEKNTPNSKNIVSMVPSPGSSVIGTTTTGTESLASRGVYSYNNLLWTAATNGHLYSSTIAGTVTDVGTLTEKLSDVDFADNGLTMLVVDGTNGYLYTKSTNTFAQITDPDFPQNPVHVEFMDGYFIVLEGGSGRFWLSALDDGSSWNALDFATAEGSPDNLVGIKVNHRQLWLFGDKTTEIWYNSGDKDFPFRRIQGSFFEEGTLSGRSIAKSNTSVVWLSNSERGEAAIYIASTTRPERISTLGMELEFDTYQKLSNANGYMFYEDTHLFYVLTFPTDEKTWVYDLTTGMWHERSTNNRRWIGQYGAVISGGLYAADALSGRILKIDSAYNDDYGVDIRRVRAGRHIHKNRDRLECDSLEIEFEHGLGTVDITNPQVMLRVSHDGGYTWSNENTKGAGVMGDYRSRAKFNRLGTARDFVFEVSVSDHVPWVMVGAYAEMVAT